MPPKKGGSWIGRLLLDESNAEEDEAVEDADDPGNGEAEADEWTVDDAWAGLVAKKRRILKPNGAGRHPQRMVPKPPPRPPPGYGGAPARKKAPPMPASMFAEEEQEPMMSPQEVGVRPSLRPNKGRAPPSMAPSVRPTQALRPMAPGVKANGLRPPASMKLAKVAPWARDPSLAAAPWARDAPEQVEDPPEPAEPYPRARGSLIRAPAASPWPRDNGNLKQAPERSRSPRSKYDTRVVVDVGPVPAQGDKKLTGGWGSGKVKSVTVEDVLAKVAKEEQAASCGTGCFWSIPTKLLSWQNPACEEAAMLGGEGIIEFQAALVVPGTQVPPEVGADGDADEPLRPVDAEGLPLIDDSEDLPIAFFFAGLGEKAKDTIIKRYADFSAVATEPFVLVAACRQPGRWWFIDDDGTWGWLNGQFRPEAVEHISAWIGELAGRPGINASRVGLFGFSAGAYAVSEVLAGGKCIPLSGVGLGGVHGHGQADLEGLPKARRDGVVVKYQAYLSRIIAHAGAPFFEATHSKSDINCRWEDASPILGALTERQRELGQPDVSVRVLSDSDQDSAIGSRKNKAGHDYLKAAFLRPEFLTALLGGEAPEPAELPPGLELKMPEGSIEPAELPSPPTPPRMTTLDIEEYSASVEADDWVERAFDIFRVHGFVVIEDVLKLHQYSAVLRDCEKVAKALVGAERRGNRGPGRYSFGVGSSTSSMLHIPSYCRHLLDTGTTTLRPLLDLMFAEGERPGFQVLAGGGDFVLGDTHTHQNLHSDINVKNTLNNILPPPLLSVNYCVQELTHLNGPTAILPGTQLLGIPQKEHEDGEWKSSRLCPVKAGSALVRDVRTLHAGTPNLTPRARYLPSTEYVSKDLRATNRQDKFPPARGLPFRLYEKLSPEVQELCEELVAPEGQELAVTFARR